MENKKDRDAQIFATLKRLMEENVHSSLDEWYRREIKLTSEDGTIYDWPLPNGKTARDGTPVEEDVFILLLYFLIPVVASLRKEVEELKDITSPHPLKACIVVGWEETGKSEAIWIDEPTPLEHLALLTIDGAEQIAFLYFINHPSAGERCVHYRYIGPQQKWREDCCKTFIKEHLGLDHYPPDILRDHLDEIKDRDLGTG